MSSFALAYTSLVAYGLPEYEGAVVPWDSETFGFKVAQLRLPSRENNLPPSRDALQDWMRAEQIELVATQVPGDAFGQQSYLAANGFHAVDFSLLAVGRRLNRLPPASRIAVRPMQGADTDAILRISQSVFRFGRFHSDARFPRNLADQRYEKWMRRAIANRDEKEIILVTGPEGAPSAFIHIVLRDGVADLRLAAVDPERNNGFLGHGLMLGSLHWVTAKGAKSAQAKISSANTGILNLYTAFGFTFRDPEVVYHLHAIDSSHLLASFS